MLTRSGVRRVGIVAALGIAGLTAFQLALALGAPLGRAAWGGGHSDLPAGLRVASAVAVPVYALAALVVLRCAGFRIRRISVGLARKGTGVLAVLLALGAVANVASRSPWERFVLGPTALLLAVLSLVVLRGRARMIRDGGVPPQAAEQYPVSKPNDAAAGHRGAPTEPFSRT